MNKEQWQNLYNKLYQIHSEFLLSYNTYKNGKNKKIRNTAEREVDSLIKRADNLIRENWKAYELLTGGESNNDYSRAIDYDEFLQFRYFGGDMRDFLEKIRLEITKLN